jgi:hypothetical protein
VKLLLLIGSMLLVSAPVRAQDPVSRQMQLDRIESQQRTIIGIIRDAEMREEFRQSSERLDRLSRPQPQVSQPPVPNNPEPRRP